MSDTIILAFSEDEFQTLQRALDIAMEQSRIDLHFWCHYYENNQVDFDDSKAKFAKLVALRKKVGN